MPPAPRSAISLEPHLRRCGYGDNQLAKPFEFDGVTVPIVAFAGKPWDSWSACVAVVDMNGDSRASAASVSTLGAPTVFVCNDSGVDWWGMGPSGPKAEPRTIAWSKVGAAINEEKDKLHPSRIYASKLHKPGSLGEQLWFFDAGLMPAVEKKRGESLTRLVEDVISGLRDKLGARLNNRQAQEDVYRTVFWLLAAKILHDKKVPYFIRIDLENVDEVFDRIGKHHGETGRYPPFGKAGRPAIDAAAKRIATCGSLADVSSESLSYVYENALIDKTAGMGRRKRGAEAYDIRKELGIHSTPSVLINHMLARLWPLIEGIPEEDRHVFEPACGDAPFLRAAMRWLRDWGSAIASGDSHQYLRSHLHGLEADMFALELAKLAFTLADESHDNSWALALTQGDMFVPRALARHTSKARILLANPPYERFTEKQRKYYERQGTDITAQTKAVEMLKRALPALPPGGVFGVVAPQGLLHNKESQPVREFLLKECELTEIDVFPDNLFEHSDHEVTVLMGRKKKPRTKPGMLWYRRVREQGMEAFKERLAFSSEREVPQSRFVGSAGTNLRVPELDEVWQYLCENRTLAQVAFVGQGFSFEGRDLPSGSTTLSKGPRRGFRPCFVTARGNPPIYETPDRQWMNPASEVIQRPRAGLDGQPGQVIVNHARASRRAWKMRAWLDREGCAVKGNFLVVRSTTQGISGLFLWALLNSPVANAYVYSWSTKRHIIGGDLLGLPLPDTTRERIDGIETAAGTYLTAAKELRKALVAEEDRAAIKRALLQVDAAVLRAYDLPPHLERQLLDLFTGVDRKGVGCEFRGYYPPGLDAFVPLHELISDDYARSTLGRFRAERKSVESPDVLKALRTASEQVDELDERRRRYAHLSALLDEWAAEPEDFDSHVGPLIEQALRDSATRHFHED
ncbi:MAG: N-6 DNA methylase [Planctomycetota bacterium]